MFGAKSEYCVVFVSENYKSRRWAAFEYEVLQARAQRESRMSFLLPIVVDSVESPGLAPSPGYLSTRGDSIKQVADILINKDYG